MGPGPLCILLHRVQLDHKMMVAPSVLYVCECDSLLTFQTFSDGNEEIIAVACCTRQLHLKQQHNSNLVLTVKHTYSTQLFGNALQSVSHRKRSHDNHPIGGVWASPLLSAHALERYTLSTNRSSGIFTWNLRSGGTHEK